MWCKQMFFFIWDPKSISKTKHKGVLFSVSLRRRRLGKSGSQSHGPLSLGSWWDNRSPQGTGRPKLSPHDPGSKQEVKRKPGFHCPFQRHCPVKCPPLGTTSYRPWPPHRQLGHQLFNMGRDQIKLRQFCTVKKTVNPKESVRRMWKVKSVWLTMYVKPKTLKGYKNS